MRLVYSRTKRVRRSFTIEDQIFKKYILLYGFKEAKIKYKLLKLRIELNQPAWKIKTLRCLW
jgi:hypothetical protein